MTAEEYLKSKKQHKYDNLVITKQEAINALTEYAELCVKEYQEKTIKNKTHGN